MLCCMLICRRRQSRQLMAVNLTGQKLSNTFFKQQGWSMQTAQQKMSACVTKPTPMTVDWWHVLLLGTCCQSSCPFQRGLQLPKNFMLLSMTTTPNHCMHSCEKKQSVMTLCKDDLFMKAGKQEQNFPDLPS